MTREAAWTCVLLTIVLTVYGQFIVKWQVLRAGSVPAGTSQRIDFIVRLLLNPWILSALAAAFFAALSWMLAMTKLPLSQAYPLTALVFICVVLGGAWAFAEPLNAWRIAGVLLIVSGLVVGSRG
jgi:multidrug transporter EmrE-like cation transporter